MYEIKIKASFSSAHNLKNYHGKCERLHGHNWVVEAVFAYGELDKNGLAIDFRKAKALLKRVTDRLDHGYLNDIPFFKRSNPTSEIIARFIYDSLKKKNKNVKQISVWENESSCAVYSGD
ncbi:MAG: 6-carboxytetrahydropterin synthase QueD [Candidatus Omnitrophica bacterium]|nr:6-carboxytetrahydropterin synthase QueD [Candidatus Omnitrophota bacterium]